MKAFEIEGGNPLVGEVQVPGSKNAALAILSSVLLVDGSVTLHNVPELSDTRIKAELLRRFGAVVEWREGTMFIDCRNIHESDADEETVRSIRTSFYLLGPLLARTKRVVLPAPGGCQIGARPVDFHLKGLALMGASVSLDGGNYIAECDKLQGAEIYLDFPSAGATQHLMATATLANGITTIQNAATEPEVTALADFLNRSGARVEGAGSNCLTIQGRDALENSEFRVPSDRCQAATYLLGGVITGGKVTTTQIDPEHQTALVSKLREAGAEVDEGPNWITAGAINRLESIRVKTMPYPGFPTDYQQPMAAALALAEGVSVIEETIYESRTGHVNELNRMGAKMHPEGRSVMIEGVHELKGATVKASDLRAGAALVLAGLAASGTTVVKNIQYIDRGYQDFEQTLSQLGGKIQRVSLPESDLVREESNS